jgi:hypothetical protein
MAHFAKIGMNGKVIQVLTLNNSDMLNADGVEDETVGQQYLQRHNNWPAQMWIQTSYNTKGTKYYNEDGTEGDQSKALRGNFAGIGMTWDEDNQIFIYKKPYPSWVLDTTNAEWKSPIGDAPDLTDAQTAENTAGTHSWSYVWNEENQSWDLTNS